MYHVDENIVSILVETPSRSEGGMNLVTETWLYDTLTPVSTKQSSSILG